VMNERMGARPWLAFTQEDYARTLLEHGQPAEAERALELLQRALETFRALGMEPHAARVAQRLRGLPVAPR